MSSRAVRDELMPEEAPETSAAPSAPLSPLQLPLDAAHQKTAVLTILSDFEAAKAARDAREYGYDAKGGKYNFDAWIKELKNLYYGHREPKTEPWKYCSNRSLMIAMAILETLHARMFGAIVNEELTKWRPGDVTDAPKAERIEKLMFWWLRVRAKTREFFDRWTRYTLAMSFSVTETSWDVWMLDRGDSMASPALPGALSAAPAKALTPVERTRSDLYPVEDVFLPGGASDIQRDPVILRMKLYFRDLEEMERNGVAVNITQPTDPDVKTLEELLPFEAPAGDQLDEQELQELKRMKLRNKEVTVLKWYGGIDFDGDGFPEEVRLLIVPEQQLYVGGTAISQISARGMRPLDWTTFLPRFDEPHSGWGMGVLEQIQELAMEIDAIFNQLTDANSLSIMRPGFYDPSGDLDAPALKLAPLKMTPIPRPNENIAFPEIKIETERLLLAIRLVLEFIERLTAASSYVMGKESEIVGGSGTATRTNAIVGAADQRHSVPLNRLREGAARIVSQHLDILQKNIPVGLEQRVLGMNGEPLFHANELTEEGIRGEFDAYLLPDESMGSKEMERQLSQLLYSVLIPNPIVASDPAKIYKATADVLKAFGKDPVQYLGPTPEIVGAISPQDEHTLILQGDFGRVKATVTQNPIEHIMAHMAFLQDPAFQQLPPAVLQQVTEFLMQHIQEHVQMMQLVMQSAAGQKPGGGSQPGANDGTNGTGADGASGNGAAPVGPEPGVGSVQSPLAKSQQVKRGGESFGAAGGPPK